MALTLSRIPLHTVLWSELPKVGLDNCRVGRVGQGALVTTSAKVLLALGLEGVVDACGRLAVADHGARAKHRGQEDPCDRRSTNHSETEDLRCPDVVVGVELMS